MSLQAALEVEAKDADDFAEWIQGLPPGSHGPAISEWIYQVEIAKGVKGKVRILVPSWHEYRAAQKRE